MDGYSFHFSCAQGNDMAKRDVLADYGIDREAIEQELQGSLEGLSEDELEKSLDESVRDYHVNTILEGRVVSVSNDEVMVDVGYKSEGAVPRYEWQSSEALEVGDTVEVLLEAVEDDSGLVQLSKRKADRIRAWERVVSHHTEDDVVTGTVMRKIKGGLLVDIGVPVFLPASQVDTRRPGDIGDYIGHDLTCKILKIDEDRRNIVVSRRQLIEGQREIMKVRLLDDLEKGQTRPGKVKNIVDFGAFVDLGGIDGLLHITDMSWGRISHPSEMLAIDDLIEVMILNVDVEKEKVALGLKQKTPSPWEDIEEKYPVGSEVQGEVVNLMSYGAFVKLEEGVEGLVHISEMSWTRRINHPSEVVAIGDVVDVVVLGINKEKEEISLGMKQTEQNPWELVQENYPPGTEVVGRVRNLTSYGAFVEIEEGIDGLLHVSDMSWTRKVSHPSEVVNKGDTIKTVVLEVDPQKRRVALGYKQLEPDPWEEEIPNRYRPGDLVRGIVTKLTNFGAFVELEDGLEGLLHVSELSEKKIPSPEEIVDVGDVLDVRIIRVDPEGRKIGLSLRTEGPIEEEEEGPRIVIRSDQLEEAEHPEQVIEEAMEEAPQFERGEEEEEPEGPPPGQAPEPGTGLEIPTAAVGEEPVGQELAEPEEPAEAAEEPELEELAEPAAEPELQELAEPAAEPELEELAEPEERAEPEPEERAEPEGPAEPEELAEPEPEAEPAEQAEPETATSEETTVSDLDEEASVAEGLAGAEEPAPEEAEEADSGEEDDQDA
jgi:small subunit ribosomal protein S1